MVLLPDTSVEQARSLAQRVCSQIAVEKFLPDKDGDSPEVTISIGVASYTHDCGFNLEKVIGRADKALYQAKAQGRNRVCVNISLESDLWLHTLGGNICVGCIGKLINNPLVGQVGFGAAAVQFGRYPHPVE